MGTVSLKDSMNATTERILIVDDEEHVRELLCATLSDAGFEARAVGTAQDAIDILELEEEGLDLVITDLKMPGMSGEELVERLGVEHPSVAVMIMTGHPSFESARAAVRAQVSDYIEKPFEDLAHVRSRVEDVLGGRRRRLNKALVFKEIAEQNRKLETERNLLARKVNVTQRNLRAQLHSLQQSREIFYTDLSRVMTIIDSLADGIIFTDPGGKVILINPAAGEMLDIPSFTALGKHLEEVNGNADLIGVLAEHRASEIGEEGQKADITTRGGEGDANYSLHTSAVHDFQGKLSGILSLLRDESIRKKSENLKNQFLSIVAHELRTPLTAIKAFGTILEKGIYGKMPDDQHQIVRDILGQSDRLGHEIDKIINLGRLDADDFLPDLQKVRATEVIEKLTLPFLTEAADKGIELVVEDTTDDAAVYGDVHDLRRALRALLENALKFTSEGGTVTLRIDADQMGVVFEVRDTGIGIAQEDQSIIFEKFIQLENPLTRKHGGSGLGLSFAAEIIGAHRSRVEVDSELGVGAAFRFRLPNSARVEAGLTDQTAGREKQRP